MKSYSVVVVTAAALALFAVNASAKEDREVFVNQGVCGIEKTLHSNLASLVTDDTSVRTLNVIQDITKNTCLNPAAHNAIVGLYDAVMDVTTNEVVAQTLGDILYVTRKVLKEPAFRVVWKEMMNGLNTVFDKSTTVKSVLDTLFTNIGKLLRSDNFDQTFDNVMTNIVPLMKFQRIPLVGMFSNMLITRGKSNASSHFDNSFNFGNDLKHGGHKDHIRVDVRPFRW